MSDLMNFGKQNGICSKKSQFKCRICKRGCKTQFSLKIHMRCHKKRKAGLYRCYVCHFTFKHQHVLSTHLQHVHFKGKMDNANECDPAISQCKCCHQKFSSLFYLKKHLTPTLSQYPFLFQWLRSLNISSSFPIAPKAHISKPGRPPKNSTPAAFNNGIATLQPSTSIQLKMSMPQAKGKRRKSQGSPKMPVPILIGQRQTNSSYNLRPQPYVALGEKHMLDRSIGKQLLKVNQKENSNVKIVSNQQSHAVLDSSFENYLSDSEFISLLENAFDEECHEEYRNPPEEVHKPVKHERKKLPGKKRGRPRIHFPKQRSRESSTTDEFASKKIMHSVDGEKMQNFLHCHSFVDTQNVIYKCLSCQYIFSSDDKLLDHFQFHFCLVCGLFFEHISQMKDHKLNHQTSVVKFDASFLQDMFEKHTSISQYGESFTCKICFKVFYQRAHLFIHMYVHAQKQPNLSSSLNGTDEEDDNDEDDYDDDDEEEDEDDDDDTSIDEDSPSKGQTYLCNHCGKIFYSHKNLMNHKEMHEEENQFSCSDCGKTFRKKRVLFKHLELGSCRAKLEEMGIDNELSANDSKDGSNDYVYKKQLKSSSGNFIVAACFTPNKQAPDEKALNDSRDRVFSCPMCNKRFFSKQILVGHMEIHNPEMKFFCPICHRGFRRKTTLQRHSDTHKKRGEEFESMP